MKALGLVVVAGVLVAFPASAFAQAALCRSTETQAECHARFKCRADEDLEACQRRVLQCRSGESLGECKTRRQQESSGDDRDDRDDARDDRDDDRRDDRSDRGSGRGRDDDRADRGRRRGRDDDGRSGRRRGGRGGGGRGGGGGGGNRFVANKTFGLGIELGAPTGLTGKYFFSDRAAFDFGVGANYSHYYYDDGLHLYGDVLFHPVSLTSAEAFELPFFIGGGLRFWDFEYCDGNVCGYGGSAIGIRIPFGIAFDFNRAPLDISLQVVPVFDFLGDDYYDRYRDRTHTGVDFSVSLRYWFK